MNVKELFEKLQESVILKLDEHEIRCPKCNGLRMVLVQEGENSYIEQCGNCHTGKVSLCEYCGAENKSYGYCSCDESYKDRRKQEKIRHEEQMDKAEVVSIKDYKGYLNLMYNEEQTVGVEYYTEEYIDSFEPTYPKRVFALKSEQLFGLNIYDIISDKAEDGYEDMINYLDMESSLLSQAQELLDQWVEKNKESLKIYYEDRSKVVDLTELYDEAMKEME